MFLRSNVIQDSGKLLKLETKLGDMNQSTLLDEVIISGINTSARDLVKNPKLFGDVDQTKAPIELTLAPEASSVDTSSF